MHWPHIEIFLNQNLHRATFGEEDLLDLVLYKGRQKWTSINAFRNLFLQNHKNIFNHYNWHNVPFGKLDSYLLCPYRSSSSASVKRLWYSLQSWFSCSVGGWGGYAGLSVFLIGPCMVFDICIQGTFGCLVNFSKRCLVTVFLSQMDLLRSTYLITVFVSQNSILK